jgi:ATP-binding cassette subfamily F protein uup
MTLLSVIRAELSFGMTPLLDAASLTVVEGERIGFIGRNGSGKSSLLNALAGRLILDGGEVRPREGLRVVLVEQEPELPAAPDLRSSLMLRGGGTGAEGSGIDGGRDDDGPARPGAARLPEFLQRFALDGAIDPARCSGGERKRAALALGLAQEPDLLLLDEPTNHLDLGGIELLEDLLLSEQRGQRSAIIITHDRRFLDRVATRILELDRGRLRSYPGNFAAYETRKSEELQAEAVEQRKFDRFWAQEEVWIRKGIEARRTRNEGRVRRLEALRSQRAARRERIGAVALRIDTGDRSGHMVAELERVNKQFGDRPIAADLSLRLMRGDRLALIGPNGAGKTTLIKLILGQIAPDSGTVRSGTRREVAFFDQQRAALDPDKTLVETISPGSDWIEIGSSRKHVIAYLGDFLFAPRRAEAPVRTLSGGERNRLLLARLFARPANLLVLDEPTNDLDMETLELLESTLAEYDGTLLLVSHDRRFLDNLATQCLVAEGQGHWKEYAGGYSDWLRQRTPLSATLTKSPVRSLEVRPDRGKPAKSIKLGFKEQRELDALPGLIEVLEQEQAALHARMAQGDYHRSGAESIRADRARAAELDAQLEAKLARWIALDALRIGS